MTRAIVRGPNANRRSSDAGYISLEWTEQGIRVKSTVKGAAAEVAAAKVGMRMTALYRVGEFDIVAINGHRRGDGHGLLLASAPRNLRADQRVRPRWINSGSPASLEGRTARQHSRSTEAAVRQRLMCLTRRSGAALRAAGRGGAGCRPARDRAEPVSGDLVRPPGAVGPAVARARRAARPLVGVSRQFAEGQRGARGTGIVAAAISSLPAAVR
jgi:hypothetical protein